MTASTKAWYLSKAVLATAARKALQVRQCLDITESLSRHRCGCGLLHFLESERELASKRARSLREWIERLGWLHLVSGSVMMSLLSVSGSWLVCPRCERELALTAEENQFIQFRVQHRAGVRE